MEAYGEIDMVGKGAANRRIGEKVIVGAQYGSYAESVVVPEEQAMPAIESYSPEENAAFAVNFMTAWVSLFAMARLRPTDRVLVNAAAGGVGTAAVQLAKAMGCTVYGTAGSDEKIALLEQLNIDCGVNYRKEDFEQKIRGETKGGGVDVVLELVGGTVYRKSIDLLAPFGRVVVAGFASLHLNRWNPVSWWQAWRSIPRPNISDMGEKSYAVMGTHLGYLLKDMPRLSGIWRELTAFVRAHELRPIVGAVFPLEDIAKAHALMETRKSMGKIVMKL
jgi:NADPH2:quinone reductase